jgi:hypothetical protein
MGTLSFPRQVVQNLISLYGNTGNVGKALRGWKDEICGSLESRRRP